MLAIFYAVIFGIVEGITEFLPISSTGHLMLLNDLLKMPQSAAFMNMFLVVIQLGAILSVVVIYFKKLNPFSPSKTSKEKRNTWTLWFKVIVAVIPSIIIGLPLNDWMDEHLGSYQVIAFTLIFYGIAFIIIENWNKNRQPIYADLNHLPWKIVIGIGLFQVLSLVPGTSRSGATILGAILLGTSRYVGAEFSFFLAIPTMFGASILKLAKYFMHGNSFTGEQWAILLVGTFVSFVIAYIAIKFLLDYIKKNDFKAFGWYRIILGIVVVLYFGLMRH